MLHYENQKNFILPCLLFLPPTSASNAISAVEPAAAEAELQAQATSQNPKIMTIITFRDFPKVNPKSYLSKVKQNTSTELLGNPNESSNRLPASFYSSVFD